jgi:hypothetical protein
MSDPVASGPTGTLQPTPSVPRGTAALVFGVVGIVIALAPFLGWIGAAFGVVALVLGARGRSNAPARARSRAGLILGIIALPLGLISFFVWFLLFAFALPGVPSGPGPHVSPVSGTFTPGP